MIQIFEYKKMPTLYHVFGFIFLKYKKASPNVCFWKYNFFIFFLPTKKSYKIVYDFFIVSKWCTEVILVMLSNPLVMCISIIGN